MPTAVDSGRAFEFALAKQLSRWTGAKLDVSAVAPLRAAYQRMQRTEQTRMDNAGKEMTLFLQAYDENVKSAEKIILQSAAAGQRGDVRDIILCAADDSREVGISAKHRHWAVKHPRLSDQLDFGKAWAECPVSSAYWKHVRPVFARLRKMSDESGGTARFADMPDKADSIYTPVLNAFEDEMVRLCEDSSKQFVRQMFVYLLGKYDYYKVVKENGTVAIQSINIHGTLLWGRRCIIPKQLDQIGRKRGSRDTLLMAFDGGWLLSFRLHNADSKITPSLKFDVQFIGVPHLLSRHEIPIDPKI